MTNDMRGVIVPKSDQWNFDDFQAGPMTFTVTGVKVKAGQEQPVEISMQGTPKFYRPCKSMARVLVAAWGADSSNYVGRSFTLYGDPKVKWGGMEVGGIRISHMSDIDETMTMALTVTRANKKPYTVRPLSKNAAPPPSPPVASSPAGGAAEAAPYRDTSDVISAAQHRRLEARISEVGIARDKVKRYVKKQWGVEHLNEITQDMYVELDTMLDNYAAEHPKPEAQSDGGIIGMKDDAL